MKKILDVLSKPPLLLLPTTKFTLAHKRKGGKKGKEKKKEETSSTELLKKKINKCKRNIGLELSFLSKVAQFPSNPQMLYLQSDLASSALGMRLLYYSLHCIGHLGESLLNLTL